jgi:hypothetical protein
MAAVRTGGVILRSHGTTGAHRHGLLTQIEVGMPGERRPSKELTHAFFEGAHFPHPAQEFSQG